MSRARIITHADERGRPVARWDETPPEAAPYGFMEPAYETTVERRQATPDELAAATARETPTRYLHTKPPATLSQLPAVGIEVVAAARATPTQQEWNGHGPKFEEATMDEPTPAPQDVIHTISTGSPLTTLSDAAAIAHEKLAAVRDAQQAWEVARAALAAAMNECFAVIGSPDKSTSDSEASQPAIRPRSDNHDAELREDLGQDAPEPPKALRQPGHHDSHPGQAAAKAERAARVTEAVARHGGDRSAAAAELGMRPNAVAMVMKFADRRAEATT